MNARNDQTPLSLAEFSAASIAMAVVAVIALNGILGSREPNLSPRNPSRSRPVSATGRSLQVSPWRPDSSAANARPRPDPPSDVVTVRKIEPLGPGSATGSQPRTRPSRTPASTFFAEAAPATIVEMVLPDLGSPYPLTGPPDLFRMKNALSTRSLSQPPSKILKSQ